MKPVAIVGARVFDGARMLQGKAVVVANGKVRDICDAGDLPRDAEPGAVEGVLAPGFVDVQVNGGGGVLFNDRPSVEGIRAIGAAHRRFGTTGFLPTLISDTRETTAAAVEAVRQGLAQRVPGLLGIHLEGPFLNPARKGAHDAAFMRPIEEEDLDIMASLGAGRTLVTLAPEQVPMTAIAQLAAAGVIVSAGHTEARADTLAAAHKKGLRGYTHLFNAMPALSGRAPGPVGTALATADAWASIIADLHHVAPESLCAAIAAKPERLLLVTDAMPSAASDMTRFSLQGRTVTVADGCLTTAEGTLAGSNLDMATAVRNTAGLGVPLPQVLRMASAIPAAFLGLENELGRIAPGCRADLVLLDDELNVKATWIDGVLADEGVTERSS